MFDGLGDAIGDYIRGTIIIMVVCGPLAIWKVIDIIVWVCKHVSITWG